VNSKLKPSNDLGIVFSCKLVFRILSTCSVIGLEIITSE